MTTSRSMARPTVFPLLPPRQEANHQLKMSCMGPLLPRMTVISMMRATAVKPGIREVVDVEGVVAATAISSKDNSTMKDSTLKR